MVQSPPTEPVMAAVVNVGEQTVPQGASKARTKVNVCARKPRSIACRIMDSPDSAAHRVRSSIRARLLKMVQRRGRITSKSCPLFARRPSAARRVLSPEAVHRRDVLYARTLLRRLCR